MLRCCKAAADEASANSLAKHPSSGERLARARRSFFVLCLCCLAATANPLGHVVDCVLCPFLTGRGATHVARRVLATLTAVGEAVLWRVDHLVLVGERLRRTLPADAAWRTLAEQASALGRFVALRPREAEV